MGWQRDYVQGKEKGRHIYAGAISKRAVDVVKAGILLSDERVSSPAVRVKEQKSCINENRLQ